VKRVLTVFLTVIFIISSLSVPVFAGEPDFVEVEENIQELPDGALDNPNEDKTPSIPKVDIEIEIGDEPESDDSSNEDKDDSSIDEFDEEAIELFALEDDYFDAEPFNARPKVYSENFENGFNTVTPGVDLEVYGDISLTADVSVIKADQAKYGDGEGEVGIESSDNGSVLMWTNHKSVPGEDAKQNVLKFFNVFNEDGLTHADKDDAYAVRFKLFIPCVDGYTRNKAQITLGTYSSYLYKADGTYPSEKPTAFSDDAKQSWTFVVPTGRWVDVYWDGSERDAAGNITSNDTLTPGNLIVNHIGISSKMALTTMYIDDFEVARMERLPIVADDKPYTVDESDMQPFDSSKYVLSNASRVPDGELGEVVEI